MSRLQPWYQDWPEFMAYQAGVGVITALGPSAAPRAAGWLARSLGPSLPLAKRVRDGIELVRPDMPEARRRQVLRGVMDNFMRTLAEYRRLDLLVAQAGEFEVEGLEHLLAAREAAGGRIVFATAHYGNWEAVRAVISLHAPAPAIIYRAFNNERVDAGCRRFLTSLDWPAFTKGREGVRDLYRHVRDGGSGMILVDQRAGGAPILDFMGKPAETSPAAAQMALKLKAPLIPVCARRVANGFVIRFEPPAPEGSPVEMMQYVNDRITEWVDAAPEQWFWLHRRWRVRNVGERGRKFDAQAAATDAGRG